MDSNHLKLLILLWVVVCGLWGLEANASLMPCQISLNPSEVVLSREVVTTQLSYNAQGHLSQVTDALNRAVHFTYDAAGRISTQTLPDGRIIAYHYDENGNLTGITPPSRPVHQFEYNPVDLQTEYHPPLLPTVTQPQTQYVWNLDKQLTQIIRPDGQTVTLNYDATKGRLNSVSLPNGTQTIAYDDKGRIGNLTATDGSQLSYGYDGALPVSETWTGTVNGTLNLTYNTDFQVTAASVNGNTVNYGYDNDGLLLQAGNLQLSHNAQNGLLLGTQLGNVTTQRAIITLENCKKKPPVIRAVRCFIAIMFGTKWAESRRNWKRMQV